LAFFFTIPKKFFPKRHYIAEQSQNRSNSIFYTGILGEMFRKFFENFLQGTEFMQKYFEFNQFLLYLI